MRVSTYGRFLEAIGMSSRQHFAHTAALRPDWNPNLSWLAGTWVPEPLTSGCSLFVSFSILLSWKK